MVALILLLRLDRTLVELRDAVRENNHLLRVHLHLQRRKPKAEEVNEDASTGLGKD